MFNIEKSVPMEKKAERISWPWKDMDIGDSVLIENQNLISKAQVSCHVYARQTGKKFSTQTTEVGLRVWRVA